tara:strand:+ start:37864 stop:40623 length:2760 start_codon:yes stop_codon:yes gene_type:complete
MADLKTTNNFLDSIASAVTAVDTAIDITDASKLPDISDPGAYTILTLIRTSDSLQEIIRVDSVVGNTLTVQRAQEGTAALSFNPGDEARNFFTSGMFESIKADSVLGGSLTQDSLVLGDDDNNAKVAATPTVANHLGSLNLKGETTEEVGLQVGNDRSGDGDSLIDLIGDTTYTDFGTRLRRFGGENAQTQISHRGTGDLQLIAQDAGSIKLKTNNTDAITIDENQNVTVAGTLNTNGTLRIWNAVDNGVDNTGVADAGAQLNTLVGLMASGDTLYLPAGTYNLSTTVSVVSKGLNVIGAGINSTTISVENSTGGFYFAPTDTVNPESIQFKGMTFTTDQFPTGYAIHVDGSGSLAERNSPRYDFNDIEIIADTAATAFSRGIWIYNCLIANFTRIAGKGYWTGTSASIASGNMIEINGPGSPVQFTISECSSYFFNRAVFINETVEGVFIVNCNFVAVNYGIYWDTTIAKPQLNVANCHINAYINCLRLLRCHQASISGCLLYRREESTSSGDAILYMFDCSDGIVHGNTFNDLNAAVGDSTCIELTGSCNYNNITNNLLLIADNGITVNISSDNNQVVDNDFSRASVLDYSILSLTTVVCDNILDKRRISAELVIKGNTDGMRFIDFETVDGVTDRNARILATGGDATTDSATLRLYSDEFEVETNGSTALSIDSAQNASFKGNVDLAAVSTEARVLQVGHGRSGDGNAFIDLVGDATYNDYGVRLRRFPGENAQTQISHRGTGDLQIITQEAATIRLKTNNVDAVVIDANQNADFEGDINLNADTTETVTMRVGRGRGDNGSSNIKFISDTTYADFGGRILKNSGANGTYDITGRGTGGIRIISQDAGSVTLKTSNTDALVIDANQTVELKDILTLNEVTAPGTPATGKSHIYLDAADGALKVKFDTGTVTTIGTP